MFNEDNYQEAQENDEFYNEENEQNLDDILQEFNL